MLASRIGALYKHKKLQDIFTTVSRIVFEHKHRVQKREHDGTKKVKLHMQVPQVTSTLVRDLYVTGNPISIEVQKEQEITILTMQLEKTKEELRKV